MEIRTHIFVTSLVLPTKAPHVFWVHNQSSPLPSPIFPTRSAALSAPPPARRPLPPRTQRTSAASAPPVPAQGFPKDHGIMIVLPPPDSIARWKPVSCFSFSTPDSRKRTQGGGVIQQPGGHSKRRAAPSQGGAPSQQPFRLPERRVGARRGSVEEPLGLRPRGLRWKWRPQIPSGR